MNADHPDRDSLTAFLEGALSIDATQWIEHHLEGCSACTATLARERGFLCRLHELHEIEAPADFVEGVMARVAQYPAHQPVAEFPWRRVAIWGGSLAATLVVLMGLAGWMLVAAAPLDSAEASGFASTGIAGFADAAKDLYLIGRAQATKAMPIVGTIFTVLAGVLAFVRDAGIMVQLAVLLLTVAFNYFFTRMVLNYQRRH